MSGLSSTTIRRQLIALGVPRDRARQLAEQHGSHNAIPTPTEQVRKMVEREARKKSAEMERKKFRLWCKVNGLPFPIFEWPFAKESLKRNWRLDVAWIEEKVGIEVHGAVFQQGRHTRGVGFLKDREKMAAAQELGWKVLEVAPHQLYQEPMRDQLQRFLEAA